MLKILSDTSIRPTLAYCKRFSDDVCDRLKVRNSGLNSKKRVRAYRTHPTPRFLSLCSSQMWFMVQPRTRLAGAGYGLLLSKGKPYKVAVTACMRKLLTILNARMRDYFAENGTIENGIQTA